MAAQTFAFGKGDRAFTERAHRWSNILAYGVAPVSAFGLTLIAARHDRRLGNWPIDPLVVAESMVLAADLNQTAKFLIGRQRPYVHNRLEGSPAAAVRRL